MSAMRPEDLHIFFLPFLAPGHMIPMVDLARIFASRGVKVTIVTTTGNAPLIRPTIARSPHPIQLLTLHLQSSVENVMGFPTPEPPPEFISAIDSLEGPFRGLLDQHRPDFIVSDIFYPWSGDLGLPRLVFHGTNAFSIVVAGIIGKLKLHEAAADENDQQLFVVPGIPHHIEMAKSHLMKRITAPDDLTIRMGESFIRSYGMVMNTVYEFESQYLSMQNFKAWQVGPVSLCNQAAVDKAVRGGESGEILCNQAAVDKAVRGGESGEISELCLNWLDGKNPGSVLYVCFGSLGRFSSSQLREIAIGLEDSGHQFVWVVKNSGDMAEWMPQGFEERVRGAGKGLILTEWVQQILILNHEAVGGFMTHCGWNSCLEGASAGLPMVTWPLFAEQFFNEKLLVSVLRVGVPVGAKVASTEEKERDLVRSAEVKKAVMEVMGSGGEADERRKRAKGLADTAKAAFEEGGSSYTDMTRLIQELMDVKAGKVAETTLVQS